MKKGNISTDQFSYKEDLSLRLTTNNYVLAVKDEDFPDRNIIPIIYCDNGNVRDIDEYDMGKIVVIPHKTINDKTLSRFNLNQLIKVSFGQPGLFENTRYYEGSSLPKCATIDSYIYPTEKNDIIEIFTGVIEESKSRIKINELTLESLIVDVYIDDNTPLFIQKNDNTIVGPFKIVEKDSEGYFSVEKHLWKTFGEYKITHETYIEFETNEIIRKIHVPSFNRLELLQVLDFKDDKEIIENFKNKLSNTPETFDKEHIESLLDILNEARKIKSIDSYISENERISEILKNTEDVIISNKELALLIPEINNIKSEIEKLKNEEFELKNTVDTFPQKTKRFNKIYFKNKKNSIY